MSEEQKKPKASKKKCFIITPIGDEGSETFRMAKGVIESVIKPVLERNGFEDIKPAYEILESGMIGNQIVDRIVNDDLVIANLTGNNPNVMYELAIRHAAAKPVIHICEVGTNLPFDIKDSRTIFYKNDMLGTKELIEGLERFVKEVDYEKEYIDNPIYNGIQTGRILKDLNDSGKQDEAQLLQQIINLLSNQQRNIARNHYKRDFCIELDCFIDYEDERIEAFRKDLCEQLPYSKIGVYMMNRNKTRVSIELLHEVTSEVYQIIRDLAKQYDIRYNIAI